jgi:hypothetical protein
MSKATDLTFRVVRLPRSLIKQMRKRRDEQQLTNEEFVSAAVRAHLPEILRSLRSLGFRKTRGPTGSARLPFSDSAKTLALLRKASNETKIPMSHLLRACLSLSRSTQSNRQG